MEGKLVERSKMMVDDEEEEFYETIEAPKFVDFTRPDPSFPDDRYWFCLRVGCDQKHEEEMDSEAIYKNFVLRVMAARSPNVRLQKALNKKPLSENKKCPLSAPPKPSKSRIPRLALVSSISKKLIDNKVVIVPPAKPNSTTPKARVKHVAAKYMTSPRNKKCPSNPNRFCSVRNPKRTSVTLQKNRVIAKALAFNSPKKAVKPKSQVESGTPITKLCEGIKKLDITNQKKGCIQKSSKSNVRKPNVPKFNAMEDGLLCPQSDKTSRSMNMQKKGQKLKSINDEKDGLSEEHLSTIENVGFCSSQGKGTSYASSSGIVPSEPTSFPSSGEGSSVEDDLSDSQVPNEKGKDSNKEIINLGVRVESESHINDTAQAHAQDDQGLGNAKDGELVDNDDKENLNSDGNRGLNSSNVHSGSDASNRQDKALKKKVAQTLDNTFKENRPTEKNMQGMKYKKLKATNPKPFRLRTDERGILKESTLERKLHPHEIATRQILLSKNTQQGHANGTKLDVKPISHNSCSDSREDSKKDSSTGSKKGQLARAIHKKKTLKSDTSIPQRRIISPRKRVHSSRILQLKTKNGRETAQCSEKGTKRSTSPFLHTARPQGEIVSLTKPGGLHIIEEESSKLMSKGERSGKLSKVVMEPTDKASTSQKSASRERKPTTIPKEPNFHSLHVPKTCTMNIS